MIYTAKGKVDFILTTIIDMHRVSVFLFLEAFFSRFAEFVDAAGGGAGNLHRISGSTGAVPG